MNDIDKEVITKSKQDAENQSDFLPGNDEKTKGSPSANDGGLTENEATDEETDLPEGDPDDANTEGIP